MNETIFDKLDFGPLKPLLDNDDITDISYCNGGQIWIRSLTQGSIRVEIPGCTQEFMEKLAFQCSNVMGTTFNNAKPFLDAESSELRLNFVHQSIATNGIACVLRKTPAKIRLQKEKLLEDDYFTNDIHDFLIKCVQGHCNIIVCGETGSGKTEFVKYLASHTKENEKIITIEDTLELHLDKIFPHRDIVSMKTNNVASYSDVLVTCMRQNPKWILLSEVRSAEAVSAVRNSISSGHNILSTIHADKASAIPYRLYSLMETDLDVEQFLSTIYRYIQLGVHIKAYYSKKYGKFHRELDEVTEFYVDDDNKCQSHTIYRKLFDKNPIMVKPSAHLLEYLSNQNIDFASITDKLEDKNFEDIVPTEEENKEVKDNEDNTSTDNNLGYNVVSDPTGKTLQDAPLDNPLEEKQEAPVNPYPDINLPIMPEEPGDNTTSVQQTESTQTSQEQITASDILPPEANNTNNAPPVGSSGGFVNAVTNNNVVNNLFESNPTTDTQQGAVTNPFVSQNTNEVVPPTQAPQNVSEQPQQQTGEVTNTENKEEPQFGTINTVNINDILNSQG